MAKRKGKPAKRSSAKSKAVYKASIGLCPQTSLPPDFSANVLKLQRYLGLEIWLLICCGVQRLDESIVAGFADQADYLPKKKIALLVHSSGGYADCAYRLARLFVKRCGGFHVVIPSLAKSAATLLSLGADSIMLGADAELGPIDAQFEDYDNEETQVSALDTVQAVDQLEETACKVGVTMLRYLARETRKKKNLLLPHALHFAAEITKPLFDKIDAVRYCRQYRFLTEAQEYATRLLRKNFPPDVASDFARHLVQNYPTHDFVIDDVEARQISSKSQFQHLPMRLPIEKPSDAVSKLLHWFHGNMADMIALGKLVETKGNEP
jgi:hypothetical protein